MYLPQINIEHSNRGIVQLILKSTVYIKKYIKLVIISFLQNQAQEKLNTRRKKVHPQK